MRVLLVLLGAAEFPGRPDLSSPTFAESHLVLRDWLLNKAHGPMVEGEDCLDLFDSPHSWPDQEGKLKGWLTDRITTASPTDLIVHYVGHGGFRDESRDYYLAIRATRADNPFFTSIMVESLWRTLRGGARQLRRFLIIDACFAGAAVRALQAPLEEAVKVKIRAFQDVEGAQAVRDAVVFPDRGTAVLCSASAQDPANMAGAGGVTQFTEGLMRVLRAGSATPKDPLSLAQVHALVKISLSAQYGENAVAPELHAPDQRLGLPQDVPLFPNLASAGLARFGNKAVPSIRAHVDAAEASRLVEQAVSGIAATTDPHQLQAYGETIRAFAKRVDAPVASRLVDQAIPVIAVTTDSDQLRAYGEMIRAFADPLASRLLVEQAVSGIAATTDSEQLRAYGETIRAFADRVDAAVASQLVDQAVSGIAAGTDSDQLQTYRETIRAFANRVDAAVASRLVEQAVPGIAATTNPHQLQAYGETIRAFANRVDKAAVDAATSRLVEQAVPGIAAATFDRDQLQAYGETIVGLETCLQREAWIFLAGRVLQLGGGPSLYWGPARGALLRAYDDGEPWLPRKPLSPDRILADFRYLRDHGPPLPEEAVRSPPFRRRLVNLANRALDRIGSSSRKVANTTSRVC